MRHKVTVVVVVYRRFNKHWKSKTTYKMQIRQIVSKAETWT